MPASNVFAIPSNATVTAMTSSAYVMAKVWSKIRSTSPFSSPFVRIITGGLSCIRPGAATGQFAGDDPDERRAEGRRAADFRTNLHHYVIDGGHRGSKTAPGNRQ